MKIILLKTVCLSMLLCLPVKADTLISGGEVLTGSEVVAALNLASEAAKSAQAVVGNVGKFEEEFIKYIESKPGQVTRIANAAKDLGKAVFGSHSPQLRSAYIYQHDNQTGYSWGFQAEDHQDKFSEMCEKRVLGVCKWNWNDEASSAKTNGKTVMACYDHASYGGERIIIGPNQSVIFTTIQMSGGGNWSDRISSCIVRQGFDALTVAFPG